VIVYGTSHDGFEFHTPHRRANAGSPPFSLRQEIDSVRTKLSLKARELAAGGQSVDVVLIGHSVGTYMLLEVIEWWQSQPSEHAIYTLKAGVCLFPTVVDLAKSHKGQSIGWLINFRFTGALLSAFATCCNWLGVLEMLARFITPGVDGGKVTAALARSDHGVKQVIHMARDELEQIRHDKWDAAKIWGVCDPGADASESYAVMTTDDTASTRTRLYFLWGQEDYWVNNDSRSQLINSKKSSAHTIMEILHERPEIPHTFSLDPEHSDHIASKVVEWIKETITDR
jgi:hypothetical protein